MTQKLALKLLDANTEAEVDDIIRNDPEMRVVGNWHPLDGRDTNFNVVNNQSSNGAKAATELMTNMVDAMLMKRCLQERIAPKGKDAPLTMYRAVKQFVFPLLKSGKLINIDDYDDLSDYAEQNLIIGVTGGKTAKEPNPCFTFCDNGEGQHPDDFKDTFLSLKAKNKSQIPFVQGKYNMGSSGVLGFCGTKGYKFILSRRYDGTGDWGWTLLRKTKLAEGDMEYIEFFAPDGEIKRFGADTPILPFVKKDKERYDAFQLKSGTVVKLYEYFLGKNFSSFRGAREAFNENLVETILPFRIWDFRHKPEKGKGDHRALGIDSRPFYGMEYLLLRTHADNVPSEQNAAAGNEEKAVNIGIVNDAMLGEIRVSVIILKKEKETTGWYQKSISRVFHHVNGQVMYKGNRGLLSQCGLPALKDRAVIMVDASNLTDSAHQNLWKGDRESIRETSVGEKYKDVVKNVIRDSSVLKALNHKIANEELETATKESSRALVQELVKHDNNFRMLLDGKVPDVLVSTQQHEEMVRTDLGRNPSYVRLRSAGDSNIEIPVNKRNRPIPLITDANDEFFMRPDNVGRLTVDNDEVVKAFSWNSNLKNGNLLFFLKPEDVQVGDKFSFKVCMESDEMPMPVCLEEEITVAITARRETEPRGSSPPRPTQPKAGLPKFRLLTRDGRYVMEQDSMSWNDFDGYAGCNQNDGGFIKEFGDDGKLYYINYDNASFQNYLRYVKDEKSAAEKKFILGMRIIMLGMEHGLNQIKDSLSEDDHIDNVRRAVAKGAAATVLTLCDQLPKHFDLFKDKPEDDGDDS